MKNKYTFLLTAFFCCVLFFQKQSYAGGVIIIDGDEGSGSKSHTCACQQTSCNPNDKSGDKNDSKKDGTYRPVIVIRIFGMTFYF